MFSNQGACAYDRLQARLLNWQAQDAKAGRSRQQPKLHTLNARQVLQEGCVLLNFCSNDYLGLSHHPLVKNAMQAASESQGCGGIASSLVSGYRPEHATLERAIAKFTHREAALVFSSGYLANLAVLSTVFGREDTIVLDRLAHASLIDAALLSRARIKRFKHNDVAHLRQCLEAQQGNGLTCVVTEGVFSMDGDVAPLSELVSATQTQAVLIVDDAHGLGVMGQHGSGVVAGQGFDQSKVPILTGAFGKAFGANGAFVAGSAALISMLVQRARPYIYTTALAPASVAAVRASLSVMQEQTHLREALRQNIMLFRRTLVANGLRPSESFTPIQPIVVGACEQALALRDYLVGQGFWVQAIRPPTVLQGTARLRITLSAAHEPDDILALCGALQRAHSLGLFEPPGKGQSSIKMLSTQKSLSTKAAAMKVLE